MLIKIKKLHHVKHNIKKYGELPIWALEILR